MMMDAGSSGTMIFLAEHTSPSSSRRLVTKYDDMEKPPASRILSTRPPGHLPASFLTSLTTWKHDGYGWSAANPPGA
jgi:hypothetical protein